MERCDLEADPLLGSDQPEYLEIKCQNFCANCCRPLDVDENIDYIESSLGTSCEDVQISYAIAVVFEMAKKVKQNIHAEDNDTQISMCLSCRSVFTDLYNSYNKFLMMTETKSYVRAYVEESSLWEDKEDCVEILPDLEETVKEKVDVRFEIIKVEEKAPSPSNDNDTITLDKKEDDVDVASCDESKNVEHGNKTLATSSYVEKIPLIKLSRLPVEEINSARNWKSFLEKRLEYTTSFDKSYVEKTTCTYCKRTFLEPRLTKIHIDLVHKIIPKPHLCQLCDKKFTHKWFYKNHVEISHSGIELDYLCKICDKKFKSIKALNHHKAVLHDKRTYAFLCNYCQEGYNEIEDLRSHLIDRHPDTKEAQTALDNRNYISKNPNPSFIEEEIKKTSSYDCPNCHLSFSHVLRLEQHIRYIHEQRTACVFCELVFQSVKDCKLHEKLTHDSFQCPKCDKEFSVLTQLNRHLTTIHLTGTNLTCEVCGKTYTGLTHLKTHYKWHRQMTGVPKFVCPVCNKSYNLKHSLTNHLKYFHSNKQRPKYTCTTCGKTFFAKGHLQMHSEQFHGVKASHRCLLCPRTFTTYRGLIQHAVSHRGRAFKPRYVRTSEGEFDIMACYSDEHSTFICSICEARVGRKDHFIRHLQRQHGTVKRLPGYKVNSQKCGTCEEDFDSNNDLVEHVKKTGHRGLVPKTHINLNEAAEEAYECDICGKYIKGKAHFRRHLTLHESKNLKNRKSKTKKCKDDMTESSESDEFEDEGSESD